MPRHKAIPNLSLRSATRVADLPFVVESMQGVEANRQADGRKPHRHDYYAIMYIEQAKGIHSIDFEEHELGPHTLYFLGPGQVHFLAVEGRPLGTVILFTDDFLVSAEISRNFIDTGDLFSGFTNTPLPVTAANRPALQRIIKELEREYAGTEAWRTEFLGSYLRELLLLGRRIAAARTSQTGVAGSGLVQQFRLLLEQHYTRHHKVAEYAGKLNITPGHLNDVLKQSSGKSAKELIQQRLILEAKRHALFSDCTLGEIAFHLGYEDPAHFSRFFKRCNGTGFLEYRRSAREKYN